MKKTNYSMLYVLRIKKKIRENEVGFQTGPMGIQKLTTILTKYKTVKWNGDIIPIRYFDVIAIKTTTIEQTLDIKSFK
jgi:3-phosphoglycerate kinase